MRYNDVLSSMQQVIEYCFVNDRFVHSKGDICYVWRYVQCSTIETFISCELL